MALSSHVEIFLVNLEFLVVDIVPREELKNLLIHEDSQSSSHV